VLFYVIIANVRRGMNKQEILSVYKNEEDRLLVAKMLDKLEQSNKR
jgi:hypothetical protein